MDNRNNVAQTAQKSIHTAGEQIKLQLQNTDASKPLQAHVIENTINRLHDKLQRDIQPVQSSFSLDDPSLVLAAQHPADKAADNLAKRIREYSLHTRTNHLRETVLQELDAQDRGQQEFSTTRTNVDKAVQALKNSADRWITTLSTHAAAQAKLTDLRKQKIDTYRVISERDERVTGGCLGLNGREFSLDEARVGETLPPFHFHCRCRIVRGRRLDKGIANDPTTPLDQTFIDDVNALFSRLYLATNPADRASLIEEIAAAFASLPFDILSVGGTIFETPFLPVPSPAGTFLLRHSIDATLQNDTPEARALFHASLTEQLLATHVMLPGTTNALHFDTSGNLGVGTENVTVGIGPSGALKISTTLTPAPGVSVTSSVEIMVIPHTPMPAYMTARDQRRLEEALRDQGFQLERIPIPVYVAGTPGVQVDWSVVAPQLPSLTPGQVANGIITIGSVAIVIATKGAGTSIAALLLKLIPSYA